MSKKWKYLLFEGDWKAMPQPLWWPRDRGCAAKRDPGHGLTPWLQRTHWMEPGLRSRQHGVLRLRKDHIRATRSKWKGNKSQDKRSQNFKKKYPKIFKGIEIEAEEAEVVKAHEQKQILWAQWIQQKATCVKEDWDFGLSVTGSSAVTDVSGRLWNRLSRVLTIR